MRLHPRTIPVKRAGNEIGRLVLEHVKEFNPTFEDLMSELGASLFHRRFSGTRLTTQIHDAAKASGLTRAELWGIVGSEIQSWAKNALRSERYPDDPDHPADEA